MQSTSNLRLLNVLCELFAGAILLTALLLGTACWQRTTSGPPTGDGIRIFGWGAFSRAASHSLAAYRGMAKPTSLTRNAGPRARANQRQSATVNQLVATYEAHFRRLKGLTASAQLALHRQRFLKKPGLKVAEAEFHAKFVKTFRLSPVAREVLSKRGFVVVPATKQRLGWSYSNLGRGPSNLYYRVFGADLPVFITADSLLHAWHRSFEELVSALELHVLRPVLQRMLTKTHAKLDLSTRDGRDAYVYLAVARTLLAASRNPPAPPRRLPHGTTGEVKSILRAIQGYKLVRMPFLGSSLLLDARRFRPTGRYARRWNLHPYFQAVAWLSQVELLLHSRRRDALPSRQEEAARAVVAAMEAGKGLTEYRQLERAHALLLGRPMAVTPTALLKLCREAGLTRCQGQGRDMMRHYAALPSPAYSPRFDSRERPALRFSLLPRRFAPDVWVTSRTTTPGLPSRPSFGRSMARDLDIAFALGSDRALERLAPEMGLPHRRHLPAALEAARRTLHDVKPSQVANAVYSHWLEALMALSRTHLSEKLPKVMRTAAWQDRKLEAALGSLVELRQDSGPLVSPSMGGKGCQYPKGYVEPVPALYRALSRAAGRLALVFPRTKHFSPPRQFLKQWQTSLARLERLAKLQLANKPMGKEDLRFLSRTVDRHEGTYSGVRSYDGWYPKLFWPWGWGPGNVSGPPRPRGVRGSGGALSKLSLATLHVDTDRLRALQSGTGHPGLMVVAIDVAGKTAIYGGPVYNYYRYERPLNKRMTDDEWALRMTYSSPARPRFARNYHAR